MEISLIDWRKFKNRLAALSRSASDDMLEFLQKNGGYANIPRKQLIDYAYGLATKYVEASASLAEEMYDTVATLSKAGVPAAEVAETAEYGEVAKAINGVTKKLTTDNAVSAVPARLAKRAGADTTLKNAKRDGVQFAWILVGDTCAFCLTLASRGWQYMSKDALKNGHAEHIHANCDCTYAVRFDDKTVVKGYDPEEYRRMYDEAEGRTPEEKINSMRRVQYQENKDKINEQKKANYEEKGRRNILEKAYSNGIISVKDLSVSTNGNNIESKREELGEIPIDRIDDAIVFFSDQIRNDTVEHAIVIDKDGKVVHFVGDETGVGIYGLNLDGARILHNHPSVNGIFSFGKDDFEFMQENINAYYYLCNSEYDYRVIVIKSLNDVSYSAIYREAMEKHDFVNGELQDEAMDILRQRGYIEYDKRRIK